MSADPSVSRSLDAVTPSVSADPVAEVLARVRSEHEWGGVCRCTCGARWPDNEPEGFAWMGRHRDAERAAALREAGLIPEVRERITERLISGHGKTPEEIARGMTRVVTTYADHVTEWEAVD